MMRSRDILQYSFQSLNGHRARSALMLLAMAIGVASVVLLTALGEGARKYVVDQFSSIGSHMLIVMPGRSETSGGAPPLLGETPRDLTLDDAQALTRSSAIKYIAPVVIGEASISVGARAREVLTLGTSQDMQQVRQLKIGKGKFLPAGDITKARQVVVLGHQVKQEMFGNKSALGQWVRVGERRFRVIGVLADQGEAMGIQVRDTIFIPVASAQSLFNTESLFRILVQAKSREAIPRANQAILDILRQRHDGEEDITVIAQDAILSTFDKVFSALTYTVAGIASISLLVAGILIMNVMLVAVSQRTAEIGLLKALGAPSYEILTLFLTEAALLAIIGGSIGLGVGLGAIEILNHALPKFPVSAPAWAMVGAMGVAISTGLLFGYLPAKHAAKLNPVLSLSKR